MELKKYLTRIIRAIVSELPADSDLWIGRIAAKGGLHLRFPDKLRAITLLLKLLGPEPQPAPAEDPITAILTRIRNGTSQFQQQEPEGQPRTSLLPRPTQEALRRARALPTAAPATQSPPPKAVESSSPSAPSSAKTPETPTPPPATEDPPLIRFSDPDKPHPPTNFISDRPSAAAPPMSPTAPPPSPLLHYQRPRHPASYPHSARTDPRIIRPHPSRCNTSTPWCIPSI